MRSWIQNELARRMFFAHRPIAVLKHAGFDSIADSLERLRETNPDEAQLLGEHFVTDDPRNDPVPGWADTQREP